MKQGGLRYPSTGSFRPPLKKLLVLAKHKGVEDKSSTPFMLKSLGDYSSALQKLRS